MPLLCSTCWKPSSVWSGSLFVYCADSSPAPPPFFLCRLTAHDHLPTQSRSSKRGSQCNYNSRRKTFIIPHKMKVNTDHTEAVGTALYIIISNLLQYLKIISSTINFNKTEKEEILDLVFESFLGLMLVEVFTSYLACTTPRLSASVLIVFRMFSLSSIHDSNSWQLL